PPPISSLFPYTTLFRSALTLVHLLIDFAKIQFTKKAPLNDGAAAYVSDQFLHFLSVAFAAWFLSPGLPFAEVAALLGRGRAVPRDRKSTRLNSSHLVIS